MAKAAAKAPAEAVARTFVLEGREKKTSRVVVEPAGPAHRVSLRAPAESLSSLSRALSVKLPEEPMGSAFGKSGDFTGKGGRSALWLGPDEWLVIDTAGNDPMADCAKAKALHSATDISHRHVAIDVSGAGAADVLNAGCPRDLSLAAFPVGAAARTVLGKVEIVLLRTGEDAFRVECWRSFSDYAFTFLAEAARDVS
ncbi:sarcosine oxidase subunit gamma [Mesorhizobium koreense]|jgi:sarcosine oxidase subunit gamma|uniref:sarcosine oxidase subunit gamma n=1 Tax=Mesorhizobium koreense TaxID=3074855 RepID=UPI00287B8458|nr:sarcosine oxidase subunit gamma [Mesorhizobium sp. WR6]